MRATLLGSVLIFQLALIAGGCVRSERQDSLAVNAAKQEALKHGWSRTEVDVCEFRDGIWVVHISKVPRSIGGTDAWVKISPEGSVMEFFVNPQ